MSDQKFTPRATYTIQDRLDLAREMEARILGGYQSYQVALPGGGTQMKTLPSLNEVRQTIADLENQLAEENACSSGDRPVNYARMTRRI